MMVFLIVAMSDQNGYLLVPYVIVLLLPFACRILIAALAE
jgi:hypothetical protein